jgi:hypothetical protein
MPAFAALTRRNRLKSRHFAALCRSSGKNLGNFPEFGEVLEKLPCFIENRA